MNKSHNDLIGRVIAGKIRVESLLGRGAMGAVYTGRHITLDELVAVKVMHPELATGPAFPERFRREATTMVRLKHAGVVRVLDFGEEPDGLLYLVMELVEGRNLAALIAAEWPLAPARAANLLRQVLAAVQTAHTEGIVHRDLKPENILVLRSVNEDGEPIEVAKVCDFGIAKIRDPRSERKAGVRAPAVTTAGLVVGTPEYMSPEQARAEVLDARSDVYSVGVILYELLTRSLPFEAESAVAVVLRHISEAPEPPSKRNPAVNRTLEAICLRALEKSPDARFQSAREMRAALRELDSTAVEPPSPASVQWPRTAATQTSLHVDLDGGAAVASSTPTRDAVETQGLVAGRRRLPWILAAAGVVAAVALGAAAIRHREASAAQLASAFPPPTLATLPTFAVQSTPTPVDSPTAPAPSSAIVPPVDEPSARALPTRVEPLPPAVVMAAPPPSPTARASADSVDPPAPPQPAAPQASAPAPTVVTAPAPPPPPAVPATPPPPSFDLSTARASIAGVGSTEGVLKSAVATAIGRTTGAMTACYRTQLAAMTSPVSGAGTLHVETDQSGVVVRATANTPFSPAVGRCVAGVVSGVRFSGVDTGEASADVSLRFEVN